VIVRLAGHRPDKSGDPLCLDTTRFHLLDGLFDDPARLVALHQETGEGAEGIAVTPDGREVWVGNREADTLTILDPQTLAIIGEFPCRGFPIRIAPTPDGKKMLVSAAESGEVVVIDAKQRQEIFRRQLDLSTAADASTRLFGDRFGGSPVPVGLVVAPDGSSAWVAATQADAVVVIATAGLRVLGILEAGKEPDGMALSPVTVRPSSN